MNWAAFAAIGSLCSIAVTIAAGIFTYGRLTQRVDDGEKRADRHEQRLDNHGLLINGHAVEIARLHEWNKGAEAASKWNTPARVD